MHSLELVLEYPVAIAVYAFKVCDLPEHGAEYWHVIGRHTELEMVHQLLRRNLRDTLA